VLSLVPDSHLAITQPVVNDDCRAGALCKYSSKNIEPECDYTLVYGEVALMMMINDLCFSGF